MGFGLTLLLIVVGALVGATFAVRNAEKRRSEFFIEMRRRHNEMGPITMDVWTKAIVKYYTIKP